MFPRITSTARNPSAAVSSPLQPSLLLLSEPISPYTHIATLYCTALPALYDLCKRRQFGAEARPEGRAVCHFAGTTDRRAQTET